MKDLAVWLESFKVLWGVKVKTFSKDLNPAGISVLPGRQHLYPGHHFPLGKAFSKWVVRELSWNSCLIVLPQSKEDLAVLITLHI